MLSRKPTCSDDEFAKAFPSIPSDVLSKWRMSMGNDHWACLSQSLPVDTSCSQALSHDPIGPASSPVCSYNSPNIMIHHDKHVVSSCDFQNVLINLTIDIYNMYKKKEKENLDVSHSNIYSMHASPEVNSVIKKEECDFTKFFHEIKQSDLISRYTSIPMKTVSCWIKHICDALQMLQKDPSMDLTEFQKVFPEATMEVIDVWKSCIEEAMFQWNEDNMDSNIDETFSKSPESFLVPSEMTFSCGMQPSMSGNNMS